LVGYQLRTYTHYNTDNAIKGLTTVFIGRCVSIAMQIKYSHMPNARTSLHTLVLRISFGVSPLQALLGTFPP
jgi:hypothetical protein